MVRLHLSDILERNTSVDHQILADGQIGLACDVDIATLQKAKFVQITSNGVVENHPHDITITRETPNYTRGE